MTIKINQTDLEQKQELLARHRRNLNYLECQAAQFGSNVPLDIYNSLTAEHETVTALERELVTLGVSIQPDTNWQVLIIDPDQHWREIITKNIVQLGGEAVEYDTLSLNGQKKIIKDCAFAIIGISNQPQKKTLVRDWIKNVVELGQSIPIILLASEDDKDTTIALRQAFRDNQHNITTHTIFKETFDPDWFSRVIHKILIH